VGVKSILLFAIGFLASLCATAAPATHFFVTNDFFWMGTTPCPGICPPPQTVVPAGQTLFLFFAPLDSANAIDPGFVGTAKFRSSDPAATLPADYMFPSTVPGRQTVQVQLVTLGLQTITISDPTGRIAPSTLQLTVAASAFGIPATGRPLEIVFVFLLAAAGLTLLRIRGQS
jgi:hypothetical protein